MWWLCAAQQCAGLEESVASVSLADAQRKRKSVQLARQESERGWWSFKSIGRSQWAECQRGVYQASGSILLHHASITGRAADTLECLDSVTYRWHRRDVGLPRIVGAADVSRPYIIHLNDVHWRFNAQRPCMPIAHRPVRHRHDSRHTAMLPMCN